MRTPRGVCAERLAHSGRRRVSKSRRASRFSQSVTRRATMSARRPARPASASPRALQRDHAAARGDARSGRASPRSGKMSPSAEGTCREPAARAGSPASRCWLCRKRSPWAKRGARGQRQDGQPAPRVDAQDQPPRARIAADGDRRPSRPPGSTENFSGARFRANRMARQSANVRGPVEGAEKIRLCLAGGRPKETGPFGPASQFSRRLSSGGGFARGRRCGCGSRA